MAVNFISNISPLLSPLGEYTSSLNVIKASINGANKYIENIELVLRTFDKKKHSSEKFKEVIKKFNNELRESLKRVNVNMMIMDESISRVKDELQ
jgi:hypothetical protein